MEEALHDVPAFRDFAGLSHWDEHIPSESSILRFRHLLERHKLAEQILATVNALLQAKGLQLKAGTVVDATLIAAPSSTKNQSGERDPEMDQSKKGNQWYFGMKVHIGVDADSGLVHSVRGTSGNVNDVVEATVCCTGKKLMPLEMRASKGWTSGQMPTRTCAGMWPCGRACVGLWTRTSLWMH